MIAAILAFLAVTAQAVKPKEQQQQTARIPLHEKFPDVFKQGVEYTPSSATVSLSSSSVPYSLYIVTDDYLDSKTCSGTIRQSAGLVFDVCHSLNNYNYQSVKYVLCLYLFMCLII